MTRLNLMGPTIPHEVTVRKRARVLLSRPTARVIAAVVYARSAKLPVIHRILTKSLGSAKCLKCG